MEQSFLHELLSTHLYPFYKEIVNKEDRDIAEINELRSQMEKSFSAEQLKLADRYKHFSDLRNEYIEFQMQIRILNYGIKMGMEIQKSFNDYFNE